MAVHVTKSLCPQSHRCPAVRVCPVDALKQVRFQAPTVDAGACIDCGECTSVCPMGALQFEVERTGPHPNMMPRLRLTGH